MKTQDRRDLNELHDAVEIISYLEEFLYTDDFENAH